jgi:hypothetical protein
MFSAAAIGCMTPDLGYLLPLSLLRSDTHSLMALFGFCLPIGLAIWWLFQLLIKPAWCAVLPGSLRLRLRHEHPPSRITDWRVWLGAAAAILLGALTHLVWDGFTHEDGRGVRMLPLLDDMGPEVVGHTLRLFRWLQHVSSVVGLLIVLLAIWRWARARASDSNEVSDEPFTPLERNLWLAAYAAIPLLMLISVVAHELHARRPESLGPALTRLAFAGLKGTGASLLLVSAAIRMRLARVTS